MEKIMVVPRGELFGKAGERHFQGFKPEGEIDLEELILKNHFFQDRSKVENDPSLKQVIPYAVFQYKNRLFLYHRSQEGGEERLHHKYSLGVGGHINPEDTENNSEKDIILEAMKREWEEEIRYPHGYSPNVLGYINDDSDPVGRVHFGVVFLLQGERPEIEAREKEKLEGKLLSKKEIEKIKPKMENWSQLVWGWLRKKM